MSERIALVHVTGGRIPFLSVVQSSPHEILAPDHAGGSSDSTRRAEELLGSPRSVYFYAGRAHPKFGSVALAFLPGCEENHTGSAAPFDTGGLMHPDRRIRLRLLPADGDAERAEYCRASRLPLDSWRDVFAQVLASHFVSRRDYWVGRPHPFDPEGLYELNTDWRAWTFEIRFYEGQPIHERVAWCADEPTTELLRRQLDEQGASPPGDPPTPLQRFLTDSGALEPAGTLSFCERIEQWVQEQCLT
jgi:hypothetical protein